MTAISLRQLDRCHTCDFVAQLYRFCATSRILQPSFRNGVRNLWNCSNV